jgi:tetratricopeptide (TPR) repeat protein
MPTHASSEPAPAPLELGAARTIEQLQERVRRNPDDPSAYAQLGLALLQRVRETADPSLYPRAEQAFAEALKRAPRQLDALAGQGSLANARHKFADALRYGEQARQVNPYRAEIYGIIGDAQIDVPHLDPRPLHRVGIRRGEYRRMSEPLELARVSTCARHRCNGGYHARQSDADPRRAATTGPPWPTHVSCRGVSDHERS